jgi:phosphoribosyl-AMP cyclohydrolase
LSVKWDLSIAEKFVNQLDFSKLNGLIVVIVQDWQTNEVLMCGFANREALIKTLITGNAYYYSRSRKALWKKGESSGHLQKIKGIAIDCDNDALLYRIQQEVAACHMGYRTCFYRKLSDSGELEITEAKVFDPSDVY